jgi:DNA-binding transcriptional MerR regulator
VLRFWETRFPQIRPLKRGGGRRYYRPDDVDLLKGIRHLLYGEGYTIKGVQRILKEEGARFVQSVGRGEQQVAAPPEGRSTYAEEGGAAPEEGPGGEIFEPARAVAVRGAAGSRIPGLLAADDLQRLRAVLLELEECDRVLGSLKAPAEVHLVE